MFLSGFTLSIRVTQIYWKIWACYTLHYACSTEETFPWDFPEILEDMFLNGPWLCGLVIASLQGVNPFTAGYMIVCSWMVKNVESFAMHVL